MITLFKVKTSPQTKEVPMQVYVTACPLTPAFLFIKVSSAC